MNTLRISLTTPAVLALLLSFGCGDDIDRLGEPDAAPELSLAERVTGAWTNGGDYVHIRADGLVFAGSNEESLLAPQNIARYVIEDEVLTLTSDRMCTVPVQLQFTFHDEDSFTVSADLCPDRTVKNGTYTRIEVPVIYEQPNLLDRLADGGLYIRDIGLDIETHSNCGAGCREVVTYEWERKENGRFAMVHRVYYDVPPSSGGAVGDLVCEATWEVFALRFGQVDPIEFVEMGWILIDTTGCPYGPPNNFRIYLSATVENGEEVTIVTWWDRGLGLAFPGYVGEGGRGVPFRRCPVADRNEFGYCQPTCFASEQPDNGGTCLLPQPD